MSQPVRFSPFFLAVLLVSWLNYRPVEATQPNSGSVEFNRDIRAILSDHCFACHGPDKNRREADLRLDTEEGLLGSDGKPGTVVPGKPQESELFRRITLAEGEEKMPPAHFGKDLTAEQIDLLKRWIEQGAQYQGHWAFQPIARPAPPQLPAELARMQHPIDQFVTADLLSRKLPIASQADRRTLGRRLSFDLLGLPPDPQWLEQFASDTSPGAYEKAVDQLLASEHYGERMAQWWLDLVRYADSVGYHGDQPQSVSPYRDYVIGSFNGNRPFDRFTVEQLAGDLLPNPTMEQQIAAGYNRLGMMSAEGGVQDKEYLAKYIAERVRNVSGTWLGVTMGCCECHDHKYDTFTAREFYQMEAFFADIEERGLYSGAHETGAWGPSMQVPTPEQSAQRDALDQRIISLKKLLDTTSPELLADQQQWEKSLPQWQVVKPLSIVSKNGATLTQQEDGSILASGTSPATDSYELTFPELPEGITGIRIEVLPDPSLPQQGPGRAGNGNFVLSEVNLVSKSADGNAQEIPLQNPFASYEQVGAAGANPYKKWAIAAAIDKDAKGPTWGWAVMEQAGKPNFALIETVGDQWGGPNETVQLSLHQNLDNPQHTLGRFRISVTTSPRPVTAALPTNGEVLAVLQTAAEQRTEAQQATLSGYYRTIAPRLAPMREELASVEAERKKVNDSIPITLVTKTVAPRTVRVLARGNWMDDKGEIVEPGFPACLPQLTRPQRLTRLDLAQWIVSPEHPLTARVFVNRIWKLYFGAGLSRKLDDLGSQGEWPSHPELLDWLAIRFVDSGWDVKQLVKLIVMSETYQRDSAVSPEHFQMDVPNRWLSRQSRFRLDAEFLRDNALKVSGLLVPQIGGRSVKPYQPPGYWAYLNFPQREWQNGSGAELYRRGLYTHWQRQYLHPSMATFDAPGREECTADRPRSNTPLQSLVLLNDPSYVEAARALAEKALLQGGATQDEKLAWMVRQVLIRPIRDEEKLLLGALLESHRSQYAAQPDSAKEVVKIGEHPIPAELASQFPSNDSSTIELASWISVARVMLNLHETVTRP